jgi:hypothetical protein
MLASIELNVTNLFLFAGFAAFCVLIGYISRTSRSASLRKKVSELENEILTSHAEILQLQREKIELLKTMSESSIPVISIAASKDEKIPRSYPMLQPVKSYWVRNRL